jgi:hypothetical protein
VEIESRIRILSLGMMAVRSLLRNKVVLNKPSTKDSMFPREIYSL